ncbi:RnfABCDGE type electron transport complex subunit B [Methylomonas methanica]|uniref:Electron transport complex, RnfABCDGE type, B subunit n=1 Tax=Methylomonas methanica (strain DSM 25384 / MC09) TaxID=857087 RepID=G0A686_METMM|nr:RnfABCDGE type electron transport complex subunit B [Methylomonas methanica]AEG01714.1 electron transport complex, RnfABCDGE type, B subunit [Methylomonas methanica MC09]
MTAPLAERIDALLPQTQCRKCSFAGCKPYAEAIAQGSADINQCPPGGEQGIIKLAALLGIAAKPLDPIFGIERPRLVAVIDEADCIGCTKCLPPCPTDAILGSSKHMHTVIAAECTGCELCIAPCPVNCITMQPAADQNWTAENANHSRRRFQAKNRRLAQQETEKTERLNRQKQLLAKIKSAKTSL